MRRRDTLHLLVGLCSVGLLAACGSTSSAEPAASSDIATQVESAPVDSAPAESASADSVPADSVPAVVAAPGATNDGLYPTVVDATATTNDGTTWRFDVTLLSEYDSPQRYADAWRVLDGDDNELGIRVLTHDHAGEQPFTRSHSIEIPDGITTVFVEGRDQVNSWSGERFELDLTS